jgi:hypothetical protein
MGLHRDPANLPTRSTPTIATEMRRRLWNTILEINLLLSMKSGQPPYISPKDYDTLPPSNFDDEQLLDQNATPKPTKEISQMSVAIALRRYADPCKISLRAYSS